MTRPCAGNFLVDAGQAVFSVIGLSPSILNSTLHIVEVPSADTETANKPECAIQA